MRKIVVVSSCIFLLVGPAAYAASLNLQKLTRLASRSSGLRVRARPKVVVLGVAAMRQEGERRLDREYAPDHQAYDETLYRGLGLLPADQSLRPWLLRRAQSTNGFYDPAAKRIEARSGSTLGRTVLRAVVTALEDQAFGLRKLSGMRPGRRDVAFAGAAAVEGYAAFATGARAHTVRPVPASTPPVGAFLAIEDRFASTTGVRFIGTLQAIGGREAMFTALRRFPATTEQVLHIDAFLGREQPAPVSLPGVVGKFGLERQDLFGELDVRALLTAFGVQRVDRAATGWGGGRSGVYRDSSGRLAVAVALDWDEVADADEWAQSVAAYVAVAFGGRADVAFARSGVRTALVVGPSAADATALAESIVSD